MLVSRRYGPDVLYLRGMFGLGDNIYQRSVIRELTKTHTVYLQTAWPQLYADLPIHCVRGITRLRTQVKNINRMERWARPPPGAVMRPITYAGFEGTILQCLCKVCGVDAPQVIFDLPPLPPQNRTQPYVVVRPVTERTEWISASRGPQPEYVADVAAKLREHFRIISVADLEPDAEVALHPLPEADETYHAGEFEVMDLLSLVAGAAAVVGGVGWLVPAAIATQVPMFLIFGGWGKHNGPARIFDQRLDISRIYQAIPTRFCKCGSNSHGCDKRIDSFEEQVDDWIIRLLAQRAAAVGSGVGLGVLSGDSAAVRQGVLEQVPGA